MGLPKYPVPPVKYAGYSFLYFAPEWQVKSYLTLAGYDRGVLDLSPGRVVFTGMQILVDCPKVTEAALVPKAFPWATALAVAGAGAVAIYLTSPTPEVWRNPALPLLLMILLVTSIIQWRERWVEIVHLDETGAARKVYFRDLGELPLPGNAATRRLLNEIRLKVLEDEVK